MKQTKDNARDDATRRLLEEGARSYFKAYNALTAFEEEVQTRCRQVLERHVDELSAALQIKPSLKKSEIRDADYSEGDWTGVGAEIVRWDVPPGISYWAIYCTLHWDEGDSGCSGYVGEWLKPKSKAQDLSQRFQNLNSDVWGNGNEVGIFKAITIAEAATFEESLDEVLRQWIRLWKRVGGMKEFFKS
jgi:hypothetical protein